MLENGLDIPTLVLMVGILIILSLGVKVLLHKYKLPPLVGYVILGALFRFSDDQWKYLPEMAPEIVNFLSEIGLIVLLFRIGMKSHIRKLLKQLSRASLVLISDVLVTGTFGFITAYFWLNLNLIISLFVAVALTATSIGVTLSIWKEQNLLKTPEGDLLLDLSALDDVAAIVMMGVLFSVAPVIYQQNLFEIETLVGTSVLSTLAKLLFFTVFCYLFAHYFEAPLTKSLRKFEPKPDPIVSVVSIGLMIGAVAAFLGFSVALGAFFAGLAFSRDPKTPAMESSMKPLEDFFIPFFFIGIGFQVSTLSLSQVITATLIFFLIAFLSKTLAIYIPALLLKVKNIKALTLGISMVPRAEVTLVVVGHGYLLGPWAMTQEVYTMMVVVALLTCLISPLALKPLVKRLKSAT